MSVGQDSDENGQSEGGLGLAFFAHRAKNGVRGAMEQKVHFRGFEAQWNENVR